jgi:hypothetical protein
VGGGTSAKGRISGKNKNNGKGKKKMNGIAEKIE